MRARFVPVPRVWDPPICPGLGVGLVLGGCRWSVGLVFGGDEGCWVSLRESLVSVG